MALNLELLKQAAEAIGPGGMKPQAPKLPAAPAATPAPAPAPAPAPTGVHSLPKFVADNENGLHDLQMSLQTLAPGTPRGDLAAAVQKQSPNGQVAPYHSQIGAMLLARRNSPQSLAALRDTRALPYSQPQQAANVPNDLNYMDRLPGDAATSPMATAATRQARPELLTAGYNSIANHELEHTYAQEQPEWAATADLGSRITNAKYHASRAESELVKPSVRSPEFWQSQLSKSKAELADLQARPSATGAEDVAKLQDATRQTAEIAPSIGDLVFRSEQFAREHGKPLEHTVTLPSGKQVDINWMRQQAKQHGYWDGESMQNLLLHNSAGQQWLKDAVPATPPPDGQLNQPLLEKASQVAAHSKTADGWLDWLADPAYAGANYLYNTALPSALNAVENSPMLSGRAAANTPALPAKPPAPALSLPAAPQTQTAAGSSATMSAPKTPAAPAAPAVPASNFTPTPSSGRMEGASFKQADDMTMAPKKKKPDYLSDAWNAIAPTTSAAGSAVHSAALPVANRAASSMSMPSVPALSLGALGVAGLGYGAAYGLASDKHVGDIQQAMSKHKTPLQPNETYGMRYADMMSVPAATTPFGVPYSTISQAVRKNPALLKLMGQNEEWIDKGNVPDISGDAHYDDFSKGPAAAYLHNSLLHTLKDSKMPDGSSLSAKLTPNFNDYWNTWLKNHPAQPRTWGTVSPYEVDTEQIPHRDQSLFLRSWREQLPKDQRAALDAVDKNDPPETKIQRGWVSNTKVPNRDADGQLAENKIKKKLYEHVDSAYAPLVDKAIGFRQSLKDVGATALGAGAGALAGEGVYQMTANKNKAKRSAIVRLLAQLTGAGIGGAGTFALGTDTGRKMLSNAVLGSQTKKAGLTTQQVLNMINGNASAKKAAAVDEYSSAIALGYVLSKHARAKSAFELPSMSDLPPNMLQHAGIGALGGAALGGLMGPEEIPWWKRMLGGAAMGGAAGVGYNQLMPGANDVSEPAAESVVAGNAPRDTAYSGQGGDFGPPSAKHLPQMSAPGVDLPPPPQRTVAPGLPPDIGALPQGMGNLPDPTGSRSPAVSSALDSDITAPGFDGAMGRITPPWLAGSGSTMPDRPPQTEINNTQPDQVREFLARPMPPPPPVASTPPNAPQTAQPKPMPQQNPVVTNVNVSQPPPGGGDPGKANTSPPPGVGSITPPWLAGNQGPGDHMRNQSPQMPPGPMTASLGRPAPNLGGAVPSGGNPDQFQGFTQPEHLADMQGRHWDQARQTHNYARMRDMANGPPSGGNPGDMFGDMIRQRRAGALAGQP